jgi:cytochrome c-type biogenesis protein CcmE
MKAAVRNRLIALVALAVAGGGLAFIAFGNLGQNLVFYWSPGEMLSKGDFAYGPTIRLGGIVKAGSIEWQAQHTRLQFRIADNKEPNASSVLVSSTEVPPQMFREGIGVVVEGTFDKSQVFRTSRLMVKHSNEYRPPKPGENTKDWVEKTLMDPQASSKP